MASLKFDSSRHSTTAKLDESVYLASKLRQIKCKLDEAASFPVSPATSHPAPHHLNSTKHFQFEMNTANPTSFDHLFDQFKQDLAQHTNRGVSAGKTPVKEDDCVLVSLKSVQYSENVSRQSSIRSLVSSGNRADSTRNKTNGGVGKQDYELVADWDVFNKKNRY